VSGVTTPCPICGKHAEQGPPNVLMVRVTDEPGMGQQHDPIWSRCGYAHPECAERPPRGVRVAAPGE